MSVDFDKFNSVISLFDKQSATLSEKPYLWHKNNKNEYTSLTWKQVRNKIEKLSTALKNLGIITFRGKLWILLFIMTSFFNPSIISRLWIKEIITIDDLIVATDYMIYSSILMTSFAFISILFIIDIYKLQEIKRHLKGSITINPLERT